MSGLISFNSFSFTQGFLLGQLSVCVLLFFFIKFFIFGEVPSDPSSRRRNKQHKRSFSALRRPNLTSEDSYASGVNTTKKGPSPLRPTPPLTTTSILKKTYYNVNGHQPESVDWFNVLVAQTIAQLRTDAQQDEVILTTLTNVLNGPRRPDFLDEIKVTEVNLGEEFPIFSNCRVIPLEANDIPGMSRPSSSAGGGGTNAFGVGESTRLQARMDVDLSDAITLGIETKLVLNYPKPFAAVMPVALAVSVVRFSGTLSISFIPSTAAPTPDIDDNRRSSPTSPASGDQKNSSQTTPPTTLTFSFLPDYRLELSTRSLLGSRSRLQDVPKIAQLVEARLHDWFDERCVEPRFQMVVLPSLWPRMKNTRGGNSEDLDVSVDEEGLGKGSFRDKMKRTASESIVRPTAGSTSVPQDLLAEQLNVLKKRQVRSEGGKSHESNEDRNFMNGSGPMPYDTDVLTSRMPGSLPI